MFVRTVQEAGPYVFLWPIYHFRGAKKGEHRPTDGADFSSYTVGRSLGKVDANMYIECPYTLFSDPQAAVPASFCRDCGCECYAPGLVCIRCERREVYADEGAEPEL